MSTAHTVRLIAGRWRGRRLPVADLPGLRPTPDRVRETLFNWLMHDVQDAVCLDLFAGTGALGFEALSRGAARVLFLEQQREARQMLAANITRLQAASQALLHSADAMQWLSALAPPEWRACSLVFVDPPYATRWQQPCIDALQRGGFVAEGARIYVEAAEPLESLCLPAGWSWHRQARAGQVHYGLLRVGVSS